jgi:hypothetical protein
MPKGCKGSARDFEVLSQAGPLTTGLHCREQNARGLVGAGITELASSSQFDLNT